MRHPLITKSFIAALSLVLVGPGAAAWAQYLPYVPSGTYGWGGFPGAEHAANMREATRQRQQSTQAATERTSQMRQQYNRGLVDNARRNSAWIEQERQSVADWRLRTTQSTAAQAPRAPSGFAPPMIASAPTPPAAPAPPRDPSKLVLKWPTILREARFEAPRTRLEQLAAEKKPLKNGLSTADYQLFADQIGQMQATLRQMAPELNAAEVQLVDQFLASLLRELQGAVRPAAQ